MTMAKIQRSPDRYQLTRQDQVDYLHASILQSVPLVVFIIALTALAALSTGLTKTVTAWTVASLMAFGTQIYQAIQYKRQIERGDQVNATNRSILMFGLLVTLNALLWAVQSLLFFPSLDPARQVMMMLLMVAFTTGAVYSLCVSRTIAMIHASCTIGSISYLLITSQTDMSVVGYTGIIYLILVFVWASTHQRRIAAEIGTRQQNRRLMQTAVRQHNKARSLNNKLQKAQKSLLELNHQLEERVKQRTSLLRREISEREGVQRELESLATRDPLTRLANRAKLEEVMQSEIANADESGQLVALFFIDLDRFKEINDGLGHDIGDRVLEIVARRLQHRAENAACVARWGGDEFIIIQPIGHVSSDRLEAFAADLGAHLREPIQLGANSLGVGASVGIALYPTHGKDTEALIRHADLAVYQAKLDGRGRARLFQPIWQKQAKDRLDMVKALKAAITNEELRIAYQPIVNPSTAQVTAMEALLRWDHPELGEIAPEIFVRLAEENGLMVSLGNWVLRQAGRDAKILIGPNCPCITVNVSINQFTHGDFIGVLDTVLAENKLPPSVIELEMTETVYARDEQGVRETLQAIRERGLRIAIDDFGTGYSSLSYLQRFPVDVLKVDRSFVLSLDSGGDTIIGAVASMAKSLNVSVVVEGIESVNQLRRVRDLGATSVQGFLFSPPMPLEEAQTWLTKHQSRTLRTASPV